MKKVLFVVLICLTAGLQAQQTLNETLLHNGVRRSYIVYIPATYSGDSPVPLMFNFHGYGMSANDQMTWGGDMRPVADTATFILVYPQGTPFRGSTHWNVGSWTSGSPADDLGFIETMIDTLASRYSLDLDRVYSCGYSNGGYFSFELACQLSSRIAAIGSVGGTMSTETFTTCSPSHPTPVISIHGTADFIVSYFGRNPRNSESMATVNSYWATFNNTIAAPIVTDVPNTDASDGSTVEYRLYDDGDKGTSVAHYKVIDGAHDWPGSWGNMDIHASSLIWEFVSQYDINGLRGGITTSTDHILAEENKIWVYPNPSSKRYYH